jgi:hypothetical protein
MIILCEYWKDKNAERQKELDFALSINQSLSFVSKIILFTENGATFDGPKIEHIPCPKRPTYFEIFQVANHYSDTCAVINTDIHFLPETEECLKRFDLNTHVLCLSRWDAQRDGSLVPFTTGGSYDTYIFKSPLPIREQFSNHTAGIPGCDAKLCFAMNQIRSALNPALTVVTVHVHMSGIRNLDCNTRLFGNYHVVPVSK